MRMTAPNMDFNNGKSSIFESDEARVFVVDDDKSVTKAMVRVLASAGHKVETFSSAEDFLSRAPYLELGCIFLELRLPGMNGLEMQKELERRKSHLPIVFLSGTGDIPTSVRAIQSGALNFLTKPVRAEQVLSAAKQAIERHQKLLKKSKWFREIMEKFDR